MLRFLLLLILIASFFQANSEELWINSAAPSAATIRRFILDENKSVLYAFGNKNVIYKTSDLDNFEGWEEVKINFANYTREYNINSQGQIYLLSTDSVFLSNDMGNSFKSIMKNPVKSAWGFIFTVEDSMLINTDFGLYKYNFTKKNWDFWGPGTTPQEGNYVHDIYQKDSIVVAATVNAIYESKDFGKTWRMVRKIFTSTAGNLTSIAVLPNGNFLTCFLNDGVILLDTAGNYIKHYKNMKKVNDIVIDDFGNAYALQYSGLFQTKENLFKMEYGDTNFVLFDSNLYYGDAFQGINIPNKGLLISLRNDGLYFLKNNSTEWVKTAYSLEEAFVSLMATSKNGTIWTSVYPNYLYKSTDKGNTWIPVRSFPRQRFDIFKISKMMENSLGHVFLQCKDKVFFTTDEGNSWDEINYPSSHNYINSFFIYSNDDIIVGNDYKIYEWNGFEYQEKINWEKAVPVSIDPILKKMIFIGYGSYRYEYFENSPPAFGSGVINTGFIFDKHNNFVIGDIQHGLSYVSRADYKNFKYEHENNISCLTLKSKNDMNIAVLNNFSNDISSIVSIDSSRLKDISYNLQNTNIRDFAFSDDFIIAASDMDFYKISSSVASTIIDKKDIDEIIFINNMIDLHYDSIKFVEIFNILGESVYSSSEILNFINISSLNNGVYFLKITKSGNSIFKKFIKR